MAASLALDGNCAPINNNIVDDAKWNIDQVLKINNSILMELFEESQSDESDFEQLDDVIRSLEAEINPIEIDDCESSVGEIEYLIDSSTEDDGSASSWQGDWLESSSDHSSGMIWSMEDYVDEMDCIFEFDSVSDYPLISLEEETDSYDSLWHQTYDQPMIS